MSTPVEIVSDNAGEMMDIEVERAKAREKAMLQTASLNLAAMRSFDRPSRSLSI